MSAIEVLAQPDLKSPAAVEHVEQLMQLTREAALPERDALVSALGNLKRQSIGSTCEALVARYCDAQRVEQLRTAYKVRNLLTHGGEAPDYDLEKVGRELDDVVRLVVAADVRRAWWGT